MFGLSRRLYDFLSRPPVLAWEIGPACSLPLLNRNDLSKPRVTIRPDGWIRHDGQPFPFDGKRCWVEVAFESGVILAGRDGIQLAAYWPAEWWTWKAQDWKRNIVAYRIVRSPRLPVSA